MISAEKGLRETGEKLQGADSRTAFIWKTEAFCETMWLWREEDRLESSLEEEPAPPLLSLETADKGGPSFWRTVVLFNFINKDQSLPTHQGTK